MLATVWNFGYQFLAAKEQRIRLQDLSHVVSTGTVSHYVSHVFWFKTSYTSQCYLYLSCPLRLCLLDSRVEICRVFTRGGLESSLKNSTSHFPTTRIFFLKRDPAKHTTSLFNLGRTVHMHISAFFNPASRPGLSCKRAIAFVCVPGWNSSRKHSLRKKI